MLAKIYRHFVQPRLAFASAKARARKAGFVAFKVLAGNMEPTLTAGDIGCIKAFVYPNGAIARGQVIAYRSEKHHGVIVPSRVVALAGESVEIRNGELFVEDVHVPEPYISNGRAEQDYSRNATRSTVPEEAVYVLGDFRDMSDDSRTIGPIPLRCVVGQVVQAIPLAGNTTLRGVE
jgi:signal peptidase I